MGVLYFIGGVGLSTIVYILIHLCNNHKIYGVIEVDHRNNLCVARLTSNDLAERRPKKVMFKVNHNANLSREEQVL